MGYLNKEEAKKVFDAIMAGSEEVQTAVAAAKKAYVDNGLPEPTFAPGSYFFPEGQPPLLSDEERARAHNADLWQTVSCGEAGMVVKSFEDEAAARKFLEASDDGFGTTGGFLVKQGKETEAVKFADKFSPQDDYLAFLERAKSLPPAGPSKEEQLEAAELDATKSLLAQAKELTQHAAKIKEMYDEHSAKDPKDLPVTVYGRPAPFAILFARMFPNLMRLGGCMPGRKGPRRRGPQRGPRRG